MEKMENNKITYHKQVLFLQSRQNVVEEEEDSELDEDKKLEKLIIRCSDYQHVLLLFCNLLLVPNRYSCYIYLVVYSLINLSPPFKTPYFN